MTELDIKQIAAIVAKEIVPMLVRKRWLSLREAASEFGIGEHRLKYLGSTGVIRGFRDPDSKRKDWIFDRQSLDSYRERQAGGVVSIEEKLLALRAKARI